MSKTAKPSQAIDALMERASRALEATEYFDAESLCIEALDLALRSSDFERVSRLVLPLQECRRQRRHQAVDAGRVFVIDGRLPKPSDIQAGCYILRPPLLGIDARTLRLNANKQRVPVIIATHEPLCKSGPRVGKLPIVAVGTGPEIPSSVRVYVDPPQIPPTPAWFLGVIEALGDAAIAKALPGPAAWRVMDLVHYLDALPDHEKLLQALGEAARKAMAEPVPPTPFRRGMDNPFSF